jgi:hypothetical protein
MLFKATYLVFLLFTNVPYQYNALLFGRPFQFGIQKNILRQKDWPYSNT